MTTPEHDEQEALIQWARLSMCEIPALAMLYAIPNGGKRDPRTAARLKEEGVVPGVPDLCLPYPSGKRHGMYIEMKANYANGRRGKTSEEQYYWISELNKLGYLAVVCYGWEEARDAILNYLKVREG